MASGIEARPFPVGKPERGLATAIAGSRATLGHTEATRRLGNRANGGRKRGEVAGIRALGGGSWRVFVRSAPNRLVGSSGGLQENAQNTLTDETISLNHPMCKLFKLTIFYVCCLGSLHLEPP